MFQFFKSSLPYFLFSFLSLILFLSASGPTYSPDFPPAASVRYTFKSIPYGPDSRNTMDMALPAKRSCANTPVIIFLHGGGWVLGNKLFFRREMEQFADSGFACACINYRFVSNEHNVHHKEITSDILKAIEYIRSHSKPWAISASRMGLAGHSAGGHLSLITAYTLNDSARLKAVVSWSGPSNFLDPRQPVGAAGTNVLAIYMGRNLNTPEDTVAWKAVSPYSMVRRNSIPTLLIQGDRDQLVPAGMAKDLKYRLDSLGVVNSLLLLKNCGHLYVGSDLVKARKATFDWFKAHL
jgi:acetyl esterase/lipase